MDNQLEELKEKADILGIQYQKNIGAEKLRLKIEKANEESMANRDTKTKEKATKGGLPKGVKLTDQQIRIAIAKEPLKVRITNMSQDNNGATTVYAGVVNQFMSLSRIIPLNMDIALERCLVEDIENRKFITGVPETDKLGNRTGNFRSQEAPEYAVARL